MIKRAIGIMLIVAQSAVAIGELVMVCMVLMSTRVRRERDVFLVESSNFLHSRTSHQSLAKDRAYSKSDFSNNNG